MYVCLYTYVRPLTFLKDLGPVNLDQTIFGVLVLLSVVHDGQLNNRKKEFKSVVGGRRAVLLWR